MLKVDQTNLLARHPTASLNGGFKNYDEASRAGNVVLHFTHPGLVATATEMLLVFPESIIRQRLPASTIIITPFSIVRVFELYFGLVLISTQLYAAFMFYLTARKPAWNPKLETNGVKAERFALLNKKQIGASNIHSTVTGVKADESMTINDIAQVIFSEANKQIVDPALYEA